MKKRITTIASNAIGITYTHTHTHGKMHAYVRHTHKLREMHTHVHARALKSTHTRFILSFCFIFKLKHLFSIGVDLLIPLLYIIIFISLFRVCVQDYFVSWYRTTKIKRDKVRIFISFARFWRSGIFFILSFFSEIKYKSKLMFTNNVLMFFAENDRSYKESKAKYTQGMRRCLPVKMLAKLS